MTELSYSSPGEAIHGGFLVFGLCAAFGLRLLYRGLRNDILDSSGTPVAGRSLFIVGGILCLLPLVAFVIFLCKQGYFRAGS